MLFPNCITGKYRKIRNESINSGLANAPVNKAKQIKMYCLAFDFMNSLLMTKQIKKKLTITCEILG